jgi:hypothetical protein
MTNRTHPIIPAILISILIFIFSIAYHGYILGSSVLSGNAKQFGQSYSFVKIFFRNSELIRLLPQFLDKTYLVILQNNMEVRPSGGFMGSYARVTFEKGVLIDWRVKDIYEPDGQLEGHVEPPVPLQQAFKTGDWKLRNANWDIDFQVAAQDIKWFFDKGKEEHFDGIVVINLELIKDLLNIIGPIKPIDYPEEVDSDNFYFTAQSYAEDAFFPGSLRKQSYLHAVSTTLIDKIIHSGPLTKLKVINLVFDQLNRHQVLVWIDDQKLSEFINNRKWGGSLGSYSYDFFYPVESNLGANKANFSIERSIEQKINILLDRAQNNTFIRWINSTENNEFKWGGKYVNYQRIVIPKNASVEEVYLNSNVLNLQNDEVVNLTLTPENNNTYQTTEYDNYKEIGFWVIVPEGQELQAEIIYILPMVNDQYSLRIKRQPGLYKIPYKLYVNNELISDTVLDSDQEYTF